MSTPGTAIGLDALIELQAPAKHLQLRRTNKPSQYAGTETSNIRGRGMAFTEVRAYSAGDDIRLMDWKVTARTGKPYIKLYEEERERRVFLLIDYRRPMHFGTQVAFKHVVAAQLASMIAWHVCGQQDHLSASILHGDNGQTIMDQDHKPLPLLTALSELSHTQPQSNTDPKLEQILKQLQNQLKAGNILIVCSDFHDFNQNCQNSLREIAYRNPMRLFCIYDPIEKTPPPPANYRITDGTQTAIWHTQNPDANTRYRMQFEQRLEALNQCAGNQGFSCHAIATATEVVPWLLEQFGPHTGNHHAA